jgi:hypothetical protein
MKSKWDKLRIKAGEYSDKEYAAADREAMLEKRVSGDVLRRKNLGEKGLHMTEDELAYRTNQARTEYLRGLEDKDLKKLNDKNTKFQREVDLPKANSIEQYEHEKDAGDPNALRLSFEDWKKL